MNLNLISPSNTLGYGYVGSYLIQELSNLCDISYFPIGPITCEQKFIPYIQKTLNNAKLFDPKADSLLVYHEFKLDLHPGKGRLIGYPFFEINKFSNQVKHHIQQCDLLFVASRWAKDIVLDQTNLRSDQIFVIPLGVDPSIFYPVNKPQTDKVIYFNISKWELRKGHDLIPLAFEKANLDNYELWMMCDNPFLTEKQSKEWERYYITKLGNKVQFIPRVNTHQELAHLINLSDVGIFPSRAEAWNLEIGEFLACGKQLISTNYSGMTEYLTKDNSLLLEPTQMESMADGVWFDGTSTWPVLKLDDLVDLIRISYKNRNLNLEGIKTMKNYTWKNTSMKILEATR